ncbi:MAG: glutamyl-tRNA(Gln) amidotransferase subunit [Thermoplasmata archaeon]|nr:glutamyl-tRNA(Gln) amidotransferase subunit [Thermoplasmata archaeon]
MSSVKSVAGPSSLTGEQARAAALAERVDYKAVGFRCGLEIHQQLDTRKLFSPCPSGVVEPDQVAARTIAVLDRRLRATQSELGELDPAALAEMRKGKAFRYLAIDGLTSLVETDEEPPHPMSQDALDVGLQFAGLIKARPVAEVHVMRKTVIDGSNTSGFQRTSFIAWGGILDVEGGDVRCQTLSLEEDSARKLDDAGGLVTYTLDRLGIPLLELATETDIHDPPHAQRTAARIGALLRATGRVKRGLGTIRQDLNVSVAVGTRVEVKGCQDLRALPRIVEGEVRRQLWMHHVREALAARKPAAPGACMDVTAAFAQTGAKSVKDATARGGKVLALKLPGLAGLLKGAMKDGPRLGRELADHAKVAAGVKGIFHSDELPAYGINELEVVAVRKNLGCGPDDAFALCVEAEPIARKALEAVAARAKAALLATAGEVRAVQPDDSTRFLRPMPGAARMYPETDVPPIRITEARWKATLAHLPAKPEERVALLVKTHGVSQDTAKQLLADGLDADFAALVQSGAEPALAGRVLLQYLPTLANGERLLPRMAEVFAALKAGRFAKEAVEPLLKALDAEPVASLEHAMAKAGIGAAADTHAVDAVIAKVLASRAELVKSKGMAAMGPLMGPVMAELRGKADGAVINARLKAALEKAAEA